MGDRESEGRAGDRGRLGSVFGTLYERELRSIVAYDIERFKTRRLKAGIKPATVNRDFDRVRKVYPCAVEWGFLSEHPLRKVKRIKVDNERVRCLRAEEEDRLRKALVDREVERRKHRESGIAWSRQRGGEGRPMWPDFSADFRTHDADGAGLARFRDAPWGAVWIGVAQCESDWETGHSRPGTPSPARPTPSTE